MLPAEKILSSSKELQEVGNLVFLVFCHMKTIAKVVAGKDDMWVECHSDVFEDNNGALTVAPTPHITPQSKFFTVKLHFFKSHVCTTENPQGKVHIQKIQTHLQTADIMTKGLVKTTMFLFETSSWDGIWTKSLLQKLTFMKMVQMSIQEGVLQRISHFDGTVRQ